MSDFTMMMSFSFTPQTPEVRSMIDKNGDPWFVAKDVCDILGLTNPTMAMQALDDDERAKSDLGLKGEINIINESGLFTLIIRSDKPEAKQFRKWITSEVLPSIRKYGFYGLPNNVEIPDDPQQAYALWPHLDKQLQFHMKRARALRDAVRSCLAVMKQNAPMRVVEADKQMSLIQ
jgi:prophage antirepressor-like protein